MKYTIVIDVDQSKLIAVGMALAAVGVTLVSTTEWEVVPGVSYADGEDKSRGVFDDAYGSTTAAIDRSNGLFDDAVVGTGKKPEPVIEPTAMSTEVYGLCQNAQAHKDLDLEGYWQAGSVKNLWCTVCGGVTAHTIKEMS